MSGPTFPRVHLNGTSRDELKAQYHGAYLAVGEALDLVAQSGPNGRDYYVIDDGAFARARSEHESRLQRLRDVREELLAIYISLAG